MEKSCFYTKGANQASKVFTDHLPLTSLELSSWPNNRMVRLVECLIHYDLVFKYIKGSENILPDFLSRNPMLGHKAPEIQRHKPSYIVGIVRLDRDRTANPREDPRATRLTELGSNSEWYTALEAGLTP